MDFEVSSGPDLKLVRREDIRLHSSSPSEPEDPSATLESHYREKLERLFDRDDEFHEPACEMQECIATEPPHNENEEAYDFRLFARTVKAADPGPVESANQDHQRIALRSPTLVNSTPGFINPYRTGEYYFTEVPTAEQLERFRQAAVSSEHILEGLKIRWPGLEMPWRVTAIKSASSGQPVTSSSGERSTSEKRRRSGKKRRIAIRKNIQAQFVKELANRQSLAEKEAADREKRTKKNREKKVKRKQKEKSKKLQVAEGTG